MDVTRRGFLAGAAVTAGVTAADAASVGISVTVLPPGAGMTAQITMPGGAGINPGVYTFAEASGTTLQSYTDPRGQFTLSRTRVFNAGTPGFRVEFVRSGDGTWAGVEFWFGQIGVPPANLSNGYSVVVSGDFAGSASTTVHYCYARWRMTGNKTNGLRAGRNDWPFPQTPYATLISDKLYFDCDGQQNVAPNWPTPATPYVPMGPSSMNPAVGAPGNWAYTGWVQGWPAQYMQTISTSATPGLIAQQATYKQSTLDIAEACASIPWFFFDAVNGCQYERFVNHASDYAAPPAANAAKMGVIFSGAPGVYTTSSNAQSSPWLTDSVNGGIWYLPKPTVTIPSTGSTTATLTAESGGTAMPTGTPSYVGTGYDPNPPPGLSYAWDSPATYTAGQPWQIDGSHTPETGYVAYILWRDPWDLFSLQANATWPYNGPGWYPVEIRQGAWDYRTGSQAVAATVLAERAGPVPSWLLPSSTLNIWLNIMQTKMMTGAVNGTTGLSTVFHVMEAIGGSGQTGADTPVCDTGENWQADWINFWQNSYFAQAACFCQLAVPSANALAIATYTVSQIDPRYNGTSGWPRTDVAIASPEHVKYHDSSGTAVWTSWAACWAGVSHYLLTPHLVQQGWPQTSASFTGTISGTTLTVSGSAPSNLTNGMTITGTGVAANTQLVNQIDTLDWTVSQSQTVGPVTMQGGLPYSTAVGCVQRALLTTLVLTNDGSDYNLNDFSGISMASQIGITQFNASRNYLYGPCVAYGVPPARAWKQV